MQAENELGVFCHKKVKIEESRINLTAKRNLKKEKINNLKVC